MTAGPREHLGERFHHGVPSQELPLRAKFGGQTEALRIDLVALLHIERELSSGVVDRTDAEEIAVRSAPQLGATDQRRGEVVGDTKQRVLLAAAVDIGD